MIILDGDETISAYDRDDYLLDRTKDTVVIRLHDDEVLGLIAGLAKTSYNSGGMIHIVIEDPTIYRKDRV